MLKKIISLLCALLLGSIATGATTYHVTNTNDSGTGSFAACLTSAESDGIDSIIVFDVSGTILRTSGRFNVAQPNLIIAGATSPSGITFDFNGNSEGFRILNTSGNVNFSDLKIRNTLTNSDGIMLYGGDNCVIERCTFEYCRDEAVGITASGGNPSRNAIVAFCRIENCGSQSDPWSDGRGILITYNTSATIVGNYLYHNNRGITINTANSFMDVRNCKVEYSLSPASGAGFTNAGSTSNIIDCVANYNATSGFKYKDNADFYRSGNTGTGNTNYLESVDAGCVEYGAPLVVGDTPFPYWLKNAATPADGSTVGQRTGVPHCMIPMNPSPAYEASGVPISTTLSWTAAQVGAGTHNVYLGTSYTAVLNATTGSPEYKGNVGGISYNPGTLVNDVTYYWRIDNVGTYGTKKGDVWNFHTIALSQASNPNPVNGAIDIDINANLSWTAGSGATSHDVYLGTSYDAVLNATHASPEFKGNQTSTPYDPGQMNYWATYYWAIDEVLSGGNTVQGAVWSFTTVQDSGMPPADYYVDGVNGNDNNTGTSTQQAWKTIQKAANTLTAGKTVVVLPGTYPEAVLTGNAGTSGSPITYRAYYESGPVIINAAGKTYGFKSTKAYVTFDGFEVKSANANGILISGDATDYNIVRNCNSHNNGSDGIKIDAGDNCTVQNCLVYDSGTNGIEVVSNGEPTTIDNCTSYSNNNGSGFRSANSDTTITDSIFTNNTQWGIESYGTVAINVSYSDTWSNTNGNYDDLTKVIIGTGCISLDPLFVNPGSFDFHLQPNSPCGGTASDGGDMGYNYP